jgi:hypothetical protein
VPPGCGRRRAGPRTQHGARERREVSLVEITTGVHRGAGGDTWDLGHKKNPSKLAMDVITSMFTPNGIPGGRGRWLNFECLADGVPPDPRPRPPKAALPLRPVTGDWGAVLFYYFTPFHRQHPGSRQVTAEPRRPPRGTGRTRRGGMGPSRSKISTPLGRPSTTSARVPVLSPES